MADLRINLWASGNGGLEWNDALDICIDRPKIIGGNFGIEQLWGLPLP